MVYNNFFILKILLFNIRKTQHKYIHIFTIQCKDNFFFRYK